MNRAEALNQRLKRLREERGLSVKQVARAIEVPESTYREWEYGRGLRMPPFEKMAGLLGISTSELVTGTTPDRSFLLKDLEVIEKMLHELRYKVSSMI